MLSALLFWRPTSSTIRHRQVQVGSECIPPIERETNRMIADTANPSFHKGRSISHQFNPNRPIAVRIGSSHSFAFFRS
jgi:hypothetical protein